MVISSQPSLFNRKNAFAWALVISIALHALAALEIPGISFEKMVKPPELIIELAPPKPEPPPPPPEPVKPPEPIKPKVVPPPQAKPIPQPIVKPVNTPQPISEPPPPAVIAVAPKAEAPPTFVAPTPEPPKPTPTVNQADIDAARNQYGSALSREIANAQANAFLRLNNES